jgi:hypothetical protein
MYSRCEMRYRRNNVLVVAWLIFAHTVSINGKRLPWLYQYISSSQLPGTSLRSYVTVSVRERIINLRVSMLPHFFLPSLQIPRPLLLVGRFHCFCVDSLHELSF